MFLSLILLSFLLVLKSSFYDAAAGGNKDELINIFQKTQSLNITKEVINAQDESGKSALFLSIQNQHFEAAEYIIQVGADVNTATNEKDARFEGDTPLMLASSHGHFSTVDMLIQKDSKIDIKRKDGFHSAQFAAQNGHLDVLKLFIQKSPNVTDLKGYKGRTPLVAASKNGHLSIVKYLLSLHPQIDIDSQENDGSTPLIWATYKNHTNIVELLLLEGANATIKDNSGYASVHYAAKKGYIKVVKLITKQFPYIVNLKGSDGKSPLAIASINGHLDIVKYLVSLPQTVVDIQDNNGYTSLMFASYYNHIAIVQFLLENGADKSVKDNVGNKALDWATSANNLNVIELLKQWV